MCGCHRLLVLGLVMVAFLGAGCDSSTEPTDAETGAQDAPGQDVPGPPGSGNDRASDPAVQVPRIVPPLELPAQAPGTAKAAEALIEDLERFVTEDQIATGVPWPDLRSPDPVAVYRSSAAFQQWMMRTNPTPTLVEAYTAPGSPERGWDLDMFEYLNDLELRSGPADPPYSMRDDDVVHPAATGITDTLLAEVPEGSVAVVYWDSVGASDIFSADGQYWSSTAGWTDRGPWVAIMAPTDVGWQVWWDELTEPPAPGTRQESGLPEEDPWRADL